MRNVFVGLFFPFYLAKWLGQFVNFLDTEVVGEIAPQVGEAIKREISDSLSQEQQEK